jgi:hypothetical protein
MRLKDVSYNYLIPNNPESFQKCYSDEFVKSKSHEERRTMKSKTFIGIAEAMA